MRFNHAQHKLIADALSKTIIPALQKQGKPKEQEQQPKKGA
jgi:hypothetical protein